MAAIISEDYLSRPFTVGQKEIGRELVYNIQGTEDEDEVFVLLNDTIPPVYQGLIPDSVDAEPLGGGVWKARARYIRREDENEYTFDTGGGTQKITNSIQTISSYSAYGFDAPDFKSCIGVSEDRVEGVDITIPVYNFTETHIFADLDITPTYKLILFRLTGRINNDTFKGLNRGECLFLGASGSRRPDTRWSITYRFAASGNYTDAVIGDITGVAKLGWEYLWVLNKEFADNSAVSLVKRPVAAYVEQVYNFDSFGDLGIGT